MLKIYPNYSKILLIGPYPPPYGGVSVHLQRLRKLLDNAGHQTSIFYNPKKSNSIILNSLLLAKEILNSDYDVVHIHGYFRAYILIAVFAKFLKSYQIFFTAHNSRLFENKNRLSKALIKKFLERNDCLIAVAKHLLDDFKTHNVKLPKNVYVKNAFLPPPQEDEFKIIKTYSPEIVDFIATQKPLVIANAWKISFYNEIDLYGLDLCVELTAQLKEKYPKVGLLFALANENVNADYIQKMKQRISKLNIKENFLFMSGQKELWPLYKKADLGLRPTATDGDAVSIREALCFNTPVVASDVVSRPGKTIIYKSGDVDDLYNKVVKVLDTIDPNLTQTIP